MKTSISSFGSEAYSAFSIFLLILSSIIFAFVYSAPEAAITCLFYFIIGLFFLYFSIKDHKEQIFIYSVVFGGLMLVSSLINLYSLSFFDKIHTTKDAQTYFQLLNTLRYNFSWDSGVSNAPLSLYIWKGLYSIWGALGFEFSEYFLVQFNTLLISLSAVNMMTIAKRFKFNLRQKKRLVFLFSFCGFFWLFSSTVLRDAFLVYIFTSFILNVTNLLNNNVTIFRYSSCNILIVFAAYFLRQEIAILFLFLAMVVFLFKNYNGNNQVYFKYSSFIFLFFSLVILIFSGGYEVLMTIIIQNSESYNSLGTEQASNDSIGLKLILNQPIYIKSILGIGVLLVNPIPLWTGLSWGQPEYYLLRSFHGFYQVFTLPLFIVGLINCIKSEKSEMRSIFLYFYIILIIYIISISITSLETRHLAQFLPLYIFLCASFDYFESDGILIRDVTLYLISFVILIHALWAWLKLI